MKLHQGDTDQNDHAAMTQLLAASVEAKPVYPVIFHFSDGGRRQQVSISFPYPIEAPRREEVVSLSFMDFDKKRRVSGAVEYAVHAFFGPGTVNIPGFEGGYILNVSLTGIAEQSPAGQ